jgi:hypothetical protein
VKVNWLELGIHRVVADESGRILAMVVVDPPNARRCPITAYADGKSIGAFIDEASAKRAVEQFLKSTRSNAGNSHGQLYEDWAGTERDAALDRAREGK